MAASFTPLWINAGDTFVETFTWYQSDGTTAVNLTGYTASLTGKANSATGAGAVFDWSSYCTTPTPSNGQVVLTVPASITAGIAAELYGYYELVLTDGSGNKTRVWEGPVYGLI